MAEANAQITSGKKINVPSDAPDQIGTLLQLRADQQRNTQIQSNLALEKTNASAADDALSSAANLMDRAIRLATEGATATQTADTRAALAEEVEALQAQMVTCSQTQVQGRYIFSGDQDSSPTYQFDTAAPAGVDVLSSAPATRQVEDAAGGSFTVSKTAQEIFADDDANVFAALNTLRLSLINNDQPGITSALGSLHTAATHLDNMQAFYGAVENRIDDAVSFATHYGSQITTQISSTEDADITSAAMELMQANVQLQAAFQTQGKMPTQTLFDFLA
jgi:flagellar hook-associated protein 3 FlgL